LSSDSDPNCSVWTPRWLAPRSFQGKNGCSAGFVVDAGVDVHAARQPTLISKSVQIVLLWPLTRVFDLLQICCKTVLPAVFPRAPAPGSRRVRRSNLAKVDGSRWVPAGPCQCQSRFHLSPRYEPPSGCGPLRCRTHPVRVSPAPGRCRAWKF
jgi:hypothetical protein